MQDKNISKDMTKWTFNSSVTNVFNEMLERSIPSYNRMRSLTDSIVYNHISNNNLKNSTILDLGCSRGEAIKNLAGTLRNNKFIGYEVSEPMIESARENLARYNNVKILHKDIARDDFNINSGAILSILTLQFTPLEYRKDILNKIYNSLKDNGIFILVEKTIPENNVLTDIYYQMKHNNGYSLKEIQDKKEKLEGVLVPLTVQSNIEFLEKAGFKSIEIFWKDLNFCGFISYI